ncbi:tRNA (adenosine(37)-N6)-dimethylallyltransferase MiaA [Crassaminicella thermophila]|uniref:tRNA dimethylallyltransferase n=1 Tax=Crassaminicella thermophila TaxID=2599308 RepID=A0A5C0SFP4_CRATE|nr:tRNA (adenosine(37)-N6)-dimethylallyltransferase MiaA [Crassaminicella thermophila]QEK12174.1 tRNA (adenosine(37)-N6)-dimethylallyltransferase MiaA [Crassaminicella thermophila]
MKKPLLIIVGPTAVGKTEISINIAQKLNGEIISADSMQIYKHMDIGSAKPTLEERAGIPHYLMDEIDPREDFSVVQFQKKAKQYIDLILKKGKIPIIVGGTGLYVNSIIYDIDFTKTISNWEFRNKLEKEVQTYGNEYLHKKLEERDPDAAARIHPNNVKRVIRALEIIENGESIKDFRSALVENPDYNYVLIGLMRDRQELYERINKRVDILIKKGLVEEVKKLISLGLNEEDISMKGLGYKEIIKYLKGMYDFEEAIRILKRDTRRYAKRQITWFKRYDKIKWFNFNEYSSKVQLENDIIKYVEGKLNFI